jgi:hypothetical protein
MCLNDIADGNGGETPVVRLPGVLIHSQGAGGAVTGAQYIGADNEMFLRIYHTAFPDEALPPVCHIRIGGECMAYPNHIVALFIEGAVGVISDLQRGEYLAGFQVKRLMIMKDLQ